LCAQICSSRCQSALLRASLEHSRPGTIPARPSETSATRCWNPSRSAAGAPECPWSTSITWIRSALQPSATARPRRSYWRAGDSGVLGTWRRGGWGGGGGGVVLGGGWLGFCGGLGGGGLADAEVGVAAKPGRGHLAGGVGAGGHGSSAFWSGVSGWCCPAVRAWASVIWASTAMIWAVAAGRNDEQAAVEPA